MPGWPSDLIAVQNDTGQNFSRTDSLQNAPNVKSHPPPERETSRNTRTRKQTPNAPHTAKCKKWIENPDRGQPRLPMGDWKAVICQVFADHQRTVHRDYAIAASDPPARGYPVRQCRFHPLHTMPSSGRCGDSVTNELLLDRLERLQAGLSEIKDQVRIWCDAVVGDLHECGARFSVRYRSPYLQDRS